MPVPGSVVVPLQFPRRLYAVGIRGRNGVYCAHARPSPWIELRPDIWLCVLFRSCDFRLVNSPRIVAIVASLSQTQQPLQITS
jgi:hypothetical protein